MWEEAIRLASWEPEEEPVKDIKSSTNLEMCGIT